MPGPSEDAFIGCLIGQCIGDAAGFMVEGLGGDVCRAYADALLLEGRTFDGRRGDDALGQVSDDSQLARTLVESYVACAGFDPADCARRIASLFAEDHVVGPGRATSEAAARLAAGVPWDRAGTPPPDAGNGSAMRAGPIGLMFFDDLPALAAAAHDQGRITHADPRCSAGAVAIAGAVAQAMTEDAIDPAPFLGRLADAAEPYAVSVADPLRALAGWSTLAPAEARARIAAAGDPDVGAPADGISPFVTASVLWSLYAFLRHPDDAVGAIHAAIAVGGDVDTTAAMTGAIVGARLGVAALPAALAVRLTDRGRWGVGDLVELARAAWRVKSGAGG